MVGCWVGGVGLRGENWDFNVDFGEDRRKSGI
jgi:hypothetical protein